ncbi:hypothetical protein [Thalassorhabdomicrobium marinisediminis]|nr:hypothetical protein [Thalassorhabdomicrobium marinisediminis]
MKYRIATFVLAVSATGVQADLLPRWEVAEEALTERVFDLAGNSQ